MGKATTVVPQVSTDSVQAEGLALDLDAPRLANRLAQRIAQHHRVSIAAGLKPSGGPQRTNRAGRPHGVGHNSRHEFADSIRPAGQTRSKLAASTRVGADPFFDDWQDREAARGIEYLEIEGDVDRLIDDEIDREIEQMLK